MSSINNVNQLTTNITLNSRMPSNPIIHNLAYNDHAIHLLSTSMDTKNHIVFLVIQPEQIQLLRPALFYAIHCLIVKEIGVFLSSSCSLKTKKIIEQLIIWALFLKVKDDIQFCNR